MDRIYQVFVSSTYSDLKDERRRVSEFLAKDGFVPAGMELFPASDQQQLDFIKTVIDRCDYYVVVVGGRYGSLADDNISFTEKEYEYALSKSIPVLAFLHGAPDTIENGKADKDSSKALKLQDFRDRLSNGRLVDYWEEGYELCAKVVIAVGRASTLFPGRGWVRGDQAIDPKVLQELERLRIECNELREKISRVDDFSLTFPPHIKGPRESFACDLIVTQLEARPQTGAWKRKAIDKNTGHAEIPLREIFVSISEFVLLERPEHTLKHNIGKTVAQLANFPEDETLLYELSPETLRGLRYQLEALGLIEAVGKQDGAGFSYICWNITDMGRRYVSQELAQRK
jgi:hypothetical protein